MAQEQLPLLSVEGLTKSFVGLQALQGVSFTLQPGEIVGLIGPNGAGKTTCFHLLTGFLAPSAGQILFHQQPLAARSPAQVARLGIARTFQNIRLFSTLSVLENVQTAAQLRARPALWSTLLSTAAFRRQEADIRARAAELLDLLDLTPYADQRAGSLPYGHQRRLEIARALATTPTLLLLDEPAAGMNPAESAALHQLILELRQRFQLTVLLVEHDMHLVMNLCERILVLSEGKLIAAGTPTAIRNDERVIEAYLGRTLVDGASGSVVSVGQ
ncbi:MAG: ABC transporter ATP-binding protein [Caldilineaceae bacterium]